MRTLAVDTDILLPEGYSEYTVDSNRDLELSFTCRGSSNAYIRIVRCQKLTVRTYTAAGAEASYLFWNDSKEKQEYAEEHEVLGNASLKIAYGECSMTDSIRHSFVALREEGARALVSSAALVSSDVRFHMNVVSFAPHTVGNMENYSVVLKGGNYLMDATGKIVKGAHGSESHQSSRALCFDMGQTSTILPKLLIDEHDVQASHATGVGRVDEDQMYYMQSRGLSERQCTGLISTGYLMPITEFIDNPELKQTLRAQLEEKIANVCSI